MNDGRPEALDSAVLRNAQRGLGIDDMPVIFDLPMPLAIKRTEEFTRWVHPVLQVYCAKCHDAQHPGDFQLVPVKSRSDRSSNALRANLDATLRLVDPKNLSHSVLLSSTLRPHGNGAKPRPIFPGSNDKAYRVLAQWVNHLSAPKTAMSLLIVRPCATRARAMKFSPSIAIAKAPPDPTRAWVPTPRCPPCLAILLEPAKRASV